MKKILFIGLGGAGQRHLRIFKSLLPDNTQYFAHRIENKSPLLNADFSVDQLSSVESQYQLTILPSLTESILAGFDLIVISNPTALHYDIAKLAADNGIPIFIEKPFSHSLSGFSAFEERIIEKKIKFFVSYQRRFHPYFSSVKKLLGDNAFGRLLSIQFDIKSYVPSWRPYKDFKELYACQKKLGGGVLLTESHEIDLCYWYFGLPKFVYCTGGNFSSVTMDVEDTVTLILSYDTFLVTLNLCFMSPYKQRDLKIVGEDGFLNCFVEKSEFYGESTTTKIDKPAEIKDMDEPFLNQARYFLEEFLPGDLHYLAASKASLTIIEAAKQSMLEKREIQLVT